MSKKKLISSVVAVALAVAILFGGTFAWQSISQMALNEVYGFVNPGGRLHDDFHEITAEIKDAKTRQFDKNVYVENFTTVLEDGVQIFARIRLDEYMEIGPGAGTTTTTTTANEATPLVYGTSLTDKTTWETYTPGNTNAFREYWDWTMADEEDESVYYMPTFNKNKDSLQADVNGTFVGSDGDYKTGTPFDDYIEWTENSALKDTAVYDADNNDIDEIVLNNYTVDYAAQCGYVTAETEDHHAKLTGDGQVITMAEWQDMIEKNGGKYDAAIHGNYWVWDEDGWAYWAAPIDPDTATGLFLDGIARTNKIINEEWYYGINVVAQFITGDDLGRDDSTGFYQDGERVSPEALQLLAAIGVKVETDVATAEDLATAVSIGGTVTLTADVNLDSVLAVDKDVVINLNGYTISGNSDVFKVAGTGGVSLTINGPGTIESGEGNQDCAIWSVGDGSAANIITLNNVTVEGAMCGVYHNGSNYGTTVNVNSSTITSGDVAVYLSGDSDWGDKMNTLTITDSSITGAVSAVEVKHGNVTVTNSTLTTTADTVSLKSNGNGTCSTGYALALTNSGTDTTTGAFTVNSGYFKGAVGIKASDSTAVVDNTDTASITIKGGTFTSDPSKYVAEGYKVTEGTDSDGNSPYTVSAF